MNRERLKLIVKEAAEIVFSHYIEGFGALQRKDGTQLAAPYEFIDDVVEACCDKGFYVSNKKSIGTILTLLAPPENIMNALMGGNDGSGKNDSDCRLMMAKNEIYELMSDLYVNLGCIQPYKYEDIKEICWKERIEVADKEIRNRYFGNNKCVNKLPEFLRLEMFPTRVTRRHITSGVPCCLIYFGVLTEFAHSLYNEEFEKITDSIKDFIERSSIGLS